MAEPKKVELTYRLPLTTVTVDGTRTTITNPYTKPKRAVTYTSHIATQIEADPKTLYRLRLPDPKDSVTSCTVEVAPDGRLTSTQATVDDKSQERTRALLKLSAAAAGTLVPLAVTGFLAPALVPTMLGFTLASSASRAMWLMPDRPPPGGSDDAQQECELIPEDFGVEPDYFKADGHAAAVLVNLRWSAMKLQAAIATASRSFGDDPRSMALHLRDLTRSHVLLREESTRAEAAYAQWIAASADTKVETFHHVFRLEELPSTGELKTRASAGHGSGATPAWWQLLTQLHCVVSRDFEDVDIEDLNPDVSLGTSRCPEHIVYRIPRLATITHWSAEPAAGQDPICPAKWELTEVLRERRKVVLMQGFESSIPLRPTRRRWGRNAQGDSDTGLTFDADGILTKISTKRSDPSLERATTLAELPEQVKAGFTTGKAMLRPLTPEGRTERLKAETELINAQKELRKAQAPSAEDPLASLKSEVEKAELEARRARAQAILSDPTRSYVVVTVTPNLNHQGTGD
ncbi:hypothetical protein ACFQV2_29350 [Actinokineospora soli]|uniref:Uncharacterized protein n=1 Tax=Actinokineospora soli TaxID=1048753 RepID=A0ABW2TVC3_9PSEU